MQVTIPQRRMVNFNSGFVRCGSVGVATSITITSGATEMSGDRRNWEFRPQQTSRVLQVVHLRVGKEVKALQTFVVANNGRNANSG